MDNIIEKVATQIPDLAALIFVVWIFLRSQIKRDDTIAQMNKENLEAYQHSRTIIEDNIRVMGQVVKVIENWNGKNGRKE